MEGRGDEAVSLLQYHLLPWHYQFLLVAAFLALSLAECCRLYLGYVGNLQEKVRAVPLPWPLCSARDCPAGELPLCCPCAQDPSAHHCPALLQRSWEGNASAGRTRRQGRQETPWVPAALRSQTQLHVAVPPPVPSCRVLDAGSPWVPPPHLGLRAPSQQALLPQVPELAGFLLLSFLIQLPLLLFLLTDSQVLLLPLELAVHSLLLAFLVAELAAAFLALRTMTKQLATQFYLQQLKGGSRAQLAQGAAEPR